MHELSVCQAMLAQVARIAGERGAVGVERIVLRIGPLSGVEPALLERAFPVARAGTVADGAQLSIEGLPIRVACEHCGEETEAQVGHIVCGACGDWHTRLVSGDEMLLASVELIMQEIPACATPAAAM